MNIHIEKNTGAADAAITVLSDNDEPLASCSLWWSGALGHFEATSAAAAERLLASAEDTLREAGCAKATGPMDGDTWHRYRLITGSSGRKPFQLEPHNPPEWPGYFDAAGWSVAARYTSSEICLAEAKPRDLSRIEQRLAVKIRPLKTGDYRGELRKIHDVSVISFKDNFLYTAISFEEFDAMYSKVEALLVPDLSLIAEDADGRACGFVFALPDGDDLIVKTLAVLPERRFAGLGSLLVEQVHQAAATMGFTYAIHALQHQKNSSLRISSRHDAKVFREYTLYEKHL